MNGVRVAETEGFEPSDGFPSLVFKTSTFGRSVTSPASIVYRQSGIIPDSIAVKKKGVPHGC